MFLCLIGIVCLTICVLLYCLLSAGWDEFDSPGSTLIFAIAINILGIIAVVFGARLSLMGYPPTKAVLEENSVYEVITSFKNNDQLYSVMKEPDGSVRLVQTNQALDKGFYKAIKPTDKMMKDAVLTPLIVPATTSAELAETKP